MFNIKKRKMKNTFYKINDEKIFSVSVRFIFSNVLTLGASHIYTFAVCKNDMYIIKNRNSLFW